MANRAALRVMCLIGVIGGLAGAAWLAFDWADLPPDGTCGNFIRYKGAGGVCAEIMRSRVYGFVACLAGAAALLFAMWVARPGRRLQSA